MTARKRATIYDVAALADVSAQTVSNVLNGRVERMKDTTRHRVLLAMRKLDFHPNAQAAQLRRSRAQTIAVAVLDPSPSFLSDAFTAQVLAGAAHEARKRGYKLLLYGTTAATAPQDVASILRAREADGLVLIPSGVGDEWAEMLDSVGKTGLPFVAVQSHLELPSPGLLMGGSVRADDYGAGLACGRLLVRLGHRRTIFMATDRVWPAVERRLQGVTDGLAERDVEPPRTIAAADFTTSASVATALSFFRSEAAWSPTAVVGANDVLAVGVLKAARLSGIAVPSSLSVVGFDDLDIAEVATPPLTTVRVPGLEIGAGAVADVIVRVEDTAIRPSAKVFPVELIERDSTGPARDARVGQSQPVDTLPPDADN